MYPHVNIVEAARKVIACGVDTILGNHAHVSQPAELIPRPGKQDALVIYAFGDFVSYHPESRNSKLAYTLKFSIGKFLGLLACSTSRHCLSTSLTKDWMASVSTAASSSFSMCWRTRMATG
ncbi:CapA family protein [Pseudomonas hygromyciniae]|uniref:CapA family protein n=1 Tax=Pseudomonas hygromyciniae TaxID=2812000 RepID=UPI001F078075|nr:CapA family protein [Pseudomonas hygromyciniae]